MSDEGGLRDQLTQLLAIDTEVDSNLVERLEHFISSDDSTASLSLWFGTDRIQGSADSVEKTLATLIQLDIARIDDVLDDVINLILHHEQFQDIEARWRALQFLIEHSPPRRNVRIKLLDVSWPELSRDLDAAVEFDNSILFRKIYDEQFGSPGGTPFSLLIGDYEVSHTNSQHDSHIDDIATLQSLSGVAASAFAPLILQASPDLFCADTYGDLVRGTNLDALFQERQYHWWNSFRQSPDARFVGLVMPHVMYRGPYQSERLGRSGFQYQESWGSTDADHRLWGSAVFLFAVSCVQTFVASGWFEGIIGQDGYGVISDLPLLFESTDNDIPLFPLDVVIDESLQRELAAHGFIAARRSKTSIRVDFPSAPSAYKPQSYDDPAHADNEQLSSQLNLLLGVSRMAHYVKIFGRSLVGSGLGAGPIESRLQNWLAGYTVTGGTASTTVRSRYPLSSFKVSVTESSDSPGTLLCEIDLCPHSQIYDSGVNLQFRTELRETSRA